MNDIVARLRASEPLPACPYDKLSPHYWTAPNDKPCAVCGGVNDINAPDLCRGADTRIMGEAADEIERLRKALRTINVQEFRDNETCDERVGILKAVAIAALAPAERGGAA